MSANRAAERLIQRLLGESTEFDTAFDAALAAEKKAVRSSSKEDFKKAAKAYETAAGLAEPQSKKAVQDKASEMQKRSTALVF